MTITAHYNKLHTYILVQAFEELKSMNIEAKLPEGNIQDAAAVGDWLASVSNIHLNENKSLLARGIDKLSGLFK